MSPALKCAVKSCGNTQSELSIRLFGTKGTFLDDEWYCSDDCLEPTLRTQIEKKLAPIFSNEPNLLQRPLIGLILLESALISREQLQVALTHHKEDKTTRLGQWLQRLGFVQEKDITAALAKQSGFPRLSLDRVVINEAILRMVPARIARLQRIFPVEYDPEKNCLSVVVAFPDRSVVITLEKMLRLKIAPYVGDDSLLEEVIEQYYPRESLQGNVEEGRFAVEEGTVSIARELINRAKKLGSKDLWIERCGQHLWIRMALETEAYNLFLSVTPTARRNGVADTPLRGKV